MALLIPGSSDVRLVYYGKSKLEISGSRTYEKHFLVETPEPPSAYGDTWVKALPLIPKLGDLYVLPNEVDLGAWCQSVETTRDEAAPTFWMVVCSFASGSGDPEKDIPDPLLRPVQLSYETEDEQIPAIADVRQATTTAGGTVAITNVCGEPFDPAPTIEWSNGVITAVKNLANPDIAFFDSLVKCTNSAPFLGFPAGTVLFDKYRIPPRKYENQVPFWQVTFIFKRRREPPWLKKAKVLNPLGATYTLIAEADLGGPWTVKLLNAGKRFRDEEDLEIHPIIDPVTARTIQGDTLLDDSGRVLDWPLSETNQPFYIEFKVYEENDLNLLPIY